MSEKPTTYEYRILLTQLPSVAEFQADREAAVSYLSLGTFAARNPNEAVEAACEAGGLPDESAEALLIAVPAKSWHEREVKSRTVRLWDVGRVRALEPPPLPDEVKPEAFSPEVEPVDPGQQEVVG